jgi:hypothetical protein
MMLLSSLLSTLFLPLTLGFSFSIDSSGLKQCGTASVSWNGGTPPFYLTLIVSSLFIPPRPSKSLLTPTARVRLPTEPLHTRLCMVIGLFIGAIRLDRQLWVTVSFRHEGSADEQTRAGHASQR